VLNRTRGSHRVYTHLERPGRVVLPGHPRDDIPEGTWHNIQRQASWKGPQEESG